MGKLNFNNKNLVLNYGWKIAKKYSKIYKKGKSENSKRSFRFERARKVDSRVISKIFERKSWQK